MTTQGSLFDLPEQLEEPSGAHTLVFNVLGESVPQGSYKAVKSASTGRPVLKSSSKGLHQWRQQIGETALVAAAQRGVAGVLLDGPVRLVVRFNLPRRKSWGKRSRLGDVAVRPDFDKLCRAVADALTNVAFGDDSQITTAVIQKRPCRPGQPASIDVAVGPDTDPTCD